MRLDVNKLVGCILWERCAASHWYLFSAGGCSRPGWWPAGWRSARQCHGVVDRVEVSIVVGGAGRRRGARGVQRVHSPLTRARGERRSRSVRRLKVARHVTRRVLTPAPRAPRATLPTLCCVDSRVHSTIKCIIQFILFILVCHRSSYWYCLKAFISFIQVYSIEQKISLITISLVYIRGPYLVFSLPIGFIIWIIL